MVKAWKRQKYELMDINVDIARYRSVPVYVYTCIIDIVAISLH